MQRFLPSLSKNGKRRHGWKQHTRVEQSWSPSHMMLQGLRRRKVPVSDSFVFVDKTHCVHPDVLGLALPVAVLMAAISVLTELLKKPGNTPTCIMPLSIGQTQSINQSVHQSLTTFHRRTDDDISPHRRIHTENCRPQEQLCASGHPWRLGQQGP